MKIGKYEISILYVLLVFVPIAFVLHFTHASGTWIFIASGLAIIPLAGILGEATEHLAEHVGPGVGGLLNATFGNAAELIIAIFALQTHKHLYDTTDYEHEGGAELEDVWSIKKSSIVLSAVLVNFVALDGKSHWMEGVQLLAVYTVLGIAFYFLPPWQ